VAEESVPDRPVRYHRRRLGGCGRRDDKVIRCSGRRAPILSLGPGRIRRRLEDRQNLLGPAGIFVHFARCLHRVSM
jgi:hypothetical protein